MPVNILEFIHNPLTSLSRRNPVYPLIVLILSSIVTGMYIIYKSWTPFFTGILIVIGLTLFLYFSHRSDQKTAVGKKAPLRQRAITISSNIGAVACSIAFVVWLTATGAQGLSDLNAICMDLPKSKADESESQSAVNEAKKGPIEKVATLLFSLFQETDPEKCSARKYVATYKLGPILKYTQTGEIEKTEQVSFSHRRSSCSGTSDGPFLACLSGADSKVESFRIIQFSSRNGELRDRAENISIPYDESNEIYSPLDAGNSKNTDLKKYLFGEDEANRSCVKIPWSSSSGGRTGIGECRYHGQISFTVELKGKVTVPQTKEIYEIQGSPSEHMGAGLVRVISLPNKSAILPKGKAPAPPGTDSPPEFAKVVGWWFEATVSEYRKNLARERVEWSEEISGEFRNDDDGGWKETVDAGQQTRCLQASMKNKPLAKGENSADAGQSGKPDAQFLNALVLRVQC